MKEGKWGSEKIKFERRLLIWSLKFYELLQMPMACVIFLMKLVALFTTHWSLHNNCLICSVFDNWMANLFWLASDGLWFDWFKEIYYRTCKELWRAPYILVSILSVWSKKLKTQEKSYHFDVYSIQVKLILLN